jgi:hypothetical protein
LRSPFFSRTVVIVAVLSFSNAAVTPVFDVITPSLRRPVVLIETAIDPRSCR